MTELAVCLMMLIKHAMGEKHVLIYLVLIPGLHIVKEDQILMKYSLALTEVINKYCKTLNILHKGFNTIKLISGITGQHRFLHMYANVQGIGLVMNAQDASVDIVVLIVQ